MTYDAHRRVVVLFGGRSPSHGFGLNDTWIWNGQTWKKVQPQTSPPTRSGAAMAFDGCRGETVLFGGNRGPASTGGAEGLGATWIWDGTNWSTYSPVPSPPAVSGGRMTYESAQGRVVLFGGFVAASVEAAAVEHQSWKWDGATRTWERDLTAETLDPVGYPVMALRPPPRGHHTFEYDAQRGASWVFGGATSVPPIGGGVALSDTWRHTPNSTFTTRGLQNRYCTNPVAPPESLDDPIAGQPEAPEQEEEANYPNEISEIGRLPVLSPLGEQDPLPPGANPQPCRRESGGSSMSVSDTMMLLNVERRRVYQFFVVVCQDRPSGKRAGILIQTFNLDTLEPLGMILIKDLPSSIGSDLPHIFTDNGEWPHAHDVQSGRIYVRINSPGGPNFLKILDEDKIEAGENPVIGQVDLPGAKGVFTTLQSDPAAGVQKLLAQESFSDTSPPISFALYKHPKTGRDKMLLYYSSPVGVAQLDLQTRSIEWTRILSNECTGGPAGGSTAMRRIPMFRTGDTIYTICVARASIAAVVKIPITEDAQGKDLPGQPSIFPGPDQVKSAWGDQKRERVLLMTNVAAGLTLWTFDGKASRYVGRSGFALGQSTQSSDGFSFGFDADAGRFYSLVSDHSIRNNHKNPPVQGGLKVLDTSLTPVPQPVSFPQFSYAGELAIRVDPAAAGRPRTIFVRRAALSEPTPGASPEEAKRSDNQIRRYSDGELVTIPDEPYYLVMQDRIPLPEQGGIAQLDALTLPVAEREGITGASFDAVGSAFGIRLRSVGGISSLTRLPPQVPNSFGDFDGIPFNAGLAPSCFYPDRELVAGWVEEAQLSDLSASARGSGLEADSSTKVDLEGPFSRCTPPAPFSSLPGGAAKDTANTIWSMIPLNPADEETGKRVKWEDHFQPVECVGEDEKTYRTSGSDTWSKAICKQKERLVEASARGSLGSGELGISVAEGDTKVTVRKDAVKGVVVTSIAVARGISVGPLSIDRVETKAVAWSNGRPSDTERTSFTRTICGVHTPDYSVARCLTAAEQKQLADNWNARWGINSKMTLPAPDSEYLTGSPGGYIAGITKPIAEEIDEQLFARDFQKEVSGLEIVFYKDSAFFGPGRQVLQLAATRAIAGYGVQCLFHLIYSPSANDCVDFAAGEETFDLGDEFSGSGVTSEEGAFNVGLRGEEPAWTHAAPAPRGRGVGRLLEQIPVVRLLPIRQAGEALLSASVWLLFLLTPLLAFRRLALNLKELTNEN